MINRAVLVGRLTRDPELRYTQGGAAVATFTLAVNRQYTNSKGERDADFITCVIWRKAAENFANFTHKGSLVGIDGHIQTRNYENKEGNRVYVTEVVVDNFSLLESRSQSEQRQRSEGQSNNQSYGQNNNNYNNNRYNNNSNNGNGNNYGGNQSNASQDPFASQQNSGQAAPQNSASSSADDHSADPFADSGQQIDISDDDLPF
ncbi:single-stranded DNA-binding protein [Lactobacillus selangorensis]|uniref:single-stranded DNA-binding protein n=1 Tax=Lactobacillus selangorensis TaxID=81857 RepID=UPI000710DCCC|nr:single-stranded DNA-binding protein [Lactobacillus selangorensis]